MRPEQLAVVEAEVCLAEAATTERVGDTRRGTPLDGVVLKYLKRKGRASAR